MVPAVFSLVVPLMARAAASHLSPTSPPPDHESPDVAGGGSGRYHTMCRDWLGSRALRPPPNPPRVVLSCHPPDLPPPRSPIAARVPPPARSATATWAKERSSPPALPRHQPKESEGDGSGKQTLERSQICLKRGARCASRAVGVGGENGAALRASPTLEGSMPGSVLGPAWQSGGHGEAPTRPAAISEWLV